MPRLGWEAFKNLLCGRFDRSAVAEMRPLAETIMEEQLGPERIATVFRLSACKTAKADCAFILLSGSISKYRAAPRGWSAQPEGSLCRSLVGNDFDLVSNEAAKFIAKHWLHIEALAGSAEAA
jgi:hypothetical protein